MIGDHNYRFMRLFGRFLLSFFDIAVTGYGQDRLNGIEVPTLIVSNFNSSIDPLLMTLFFNNPIKCIVEDCVFSNSVLRRISLKVGNIHIFQNSPNQWGVHQACTQLTTGNNLLALCPIEDPEVPRNTFSLPAYLIHQTGCNFLPVALDGSAKVLPSGSIIPKVHPVRILVGKVETMPKMTDLDGNTTENGLLRKYLIGRIRALQVVLENTPYDTEPILEPAILPLAPQPIDPEIIVTEK